MAFRQSAAAIVAFAALIAVLAPQAHAVSGIIRVSGSSFVDEKCNPFYFSGYNTWQALETAGNVCCGGSAGIGAQFDEAVASNLTVVRMFAFGVTEGYNVQLFNDPGQYNESALADMDFVVSEAGKRGLKLIIALASNWIYNPTMSDSKCWYTNSTLTANNCDEFYTDPNAIMLYKQYAKTIITRVNTITNVSYANDPTIMAYDLMNEPRCELPTCTADNIQSWINTVAPYVKSLTNQLLTVGEDGFLQASNCLSNTINPVPNALMWPLQTGQDFLANHYLNSIDFTSIHFWPDNWQRTDLDFGKNWLTAHANMSSILGKPMIVEEFGKAYGGNTAESGQGQTQQDQLNYYKLTYSLVETSIDTASVIKGIAFWRWNALNTPATALASFDNAATIETNSTVFTTVIEPFSQRIAQKVALPAGTVAGCTVGAAPAPLATATPVTTTAGRRLMQAAAPAPSVSLTTVDALAQPLCTAAAPASG